MSTVAPKRGTKELRNLSTSELDQPIGDSSSDGEPGHEEEEEEEEMEAGREEEEREAKQKKGKGPKSWRWDPSTEEGPENRPLLQDPLRSSSSSIDTAELSHPREREGSGPGGKSLPRRILGQPVVLLLFLSLLALMNYFDRGAFVGVLPLIADEFEMSDTESGIIGGAFIVGYSLVSPFMAQLSRHMPSGLLMMIGMSVWVVFTGLCMFSKGFWYLVFLRCFVGIGEAAFICISPSLIDDVAPKERRTLWLAIFFSTLPIGYSLGYLGAGLIAKYLTWEWLFFLEAAFTLPLALLCFFLPNVKSTLSLWKSLFVLGSNSVYVCMTLGYCAQTFVMGALTFWLPDYVVTQYGLSLDTANFVIGAVTATCGIFGNLASSFLMDHVVNSRRKDGRVVGIYMSFLFHTLALPFAFVAVFMQTIELFLTFMLCAEFLMLFTVTPVNAVFLNSVPSELRGHSVAVATLSIHLLGDLSSPSIFGAISDATGNQRYSLFFLACWALWTSVFWLVACFLINKKVKRELLGPIHIS